MSRQMGQSDLPGGCSTNSQSYPVDLLIDIATYLQMKDKLIIIIDLLGIMYWKLQNLCIRGY